MKINFSIFSVILMVLFSNISGQARILDDQASLRWKAGVSKIDITPKEPIWLAGYGGRDHPFDEVIHPIWIKALALEDASGKQAVLITADLLAMPKALSDRIRLGLKERHGLSEAQIIINSSHSHSGPVLENSLSDIYPMNEAQKQQVSHYSDALVDSMIRLVDEAFGALRPAHLYVENGVTRFQVNRRNNPENQLESIADLKGPNDYAVPVIRVNEEGGDIMAIVFGYACHPTVLGDYRLSGDYPGFAQIELEKNYPGATALFFQGAGADQNPLPRRTIFLAQQYGKSLAAAVDRVLSEDMRQLEASIHTAYSEVDLALATPPSMEALSKFIASSSGYQKRWATRMNEERTNGTEPMKSYPFPVQVWKLGDQPIMTLGGETVISYAIELKKIFGPDIFVMGYSNDVMAYIPSTTILREGGYEGASSQMVYGLPSTWASNIEIDILHEFLRLADQVGVSRLESSLIPD
ncbi:neutral/alkaline non-lysosomal ceramidase N-terminal domain-containing protein [Cyclobacterium sp.]|uniref:neutral/alkaline non-lysosomal ceramidase N-terminal domain-containing protein n=1 Tax=Cyclobacterium sp. TaxID=1966343 RepID=UPI00198E706C|nr:neutral/alkaline non-lysosomal ceramidase N-terminal domain-containing protein [Cyclobacterium sp.]MBD3627284.1 neutral/alkaline non-lysosomal ceramidase N-terminal domain-containing protein [Cyclobacterium sp.]